MGSTMINKQKDLIKYQTCIYRKLSMNIVDYPTNTSQWSLVIHKVSENTVELWAGTLFGTLRKPKKVCLIVTLKGQKVAREDVVLEDWERPFSRLSQRFYVHRKIANLQAGLDYQVELYQQIDAPEHVHCGDWQLLRKGSFRTLPTTLPNIPTEAFTVAISSCFYEHRDSGRTANVFKNLYDRGEQSVKPDIKFMLGDQVYLDIGLDSLSPLTNEVRQRVAEDYAKHWQALGSVLTRGATWMLPDDHEYWNDYPFYDSLIPTLFMLKIAKVRNAWRAASRDGVLNVQRSAKVDTFAIANELSFRVADLRSYRSKTQFIDQQGFKQIIDWASDLTSPGVLVIPQILIVEENKQERNLRSFKKQYTDLLVALASSGHDIVVMSGNVHFGRIAQVKLGENGAKMIEVVSSPMSNLTGLNSFASDKAKTTPKHFPDMEIDGLEPQEVEYNNAFNVHTKRGFIGSSYWQERTK
jgi:hypothetical protein